MFVIPTHSRVIFTITNGLLHKKKTLFSNEKISFDVKSYRKALHHILERLKKKTTQNKIKTIKKSNIR